MNFSKLLHPDTLEKAYTELSLQEDTSLLAGGLFSRLSKKQTDTVITLSSLKLDYIKKSDNYLQIGSMTNLRELETNTLTFPFFKTAVNRIGSIQIRNIATIGGTICGKYSFSDLITPLLALNAELIFHKNGNILLKKFLEMKNFKDILLEIKIPAQVKISNKQFKRTYNDFSLLNISLAQGNEVCVAVGARPGIAKIGYLGKPDSFNNVLEMVKKKITVGSNTKASKEYREALLENLLKEAFDEINYNQD